MNQETKQDKVVAARQEAHDRLEKQGQEQGWHALHVLVDKDGFLFIPPNRHQRRRAAKLARKSGGAA